MGNDYDKRKKAKRQWKKVAGQRDKEALEAGTKRRKKGERRLCQVRGARDGPSAGRAVAATA
jgi:hypothetical protein